MKRKKQKTPGGFLARHLDIPEEGLSEIPVTELHGMSSVLITGCRTILSYEETTVGLETDLGVLEVCGEGLTINAFSGDRITVEGHIRDVRYAEEKQI